MSEMSIKLALSQDGTPTLAAFVKCHQNEQQFRITVQVYT